MSSSVIVIILNNYNIGDSSEPEGHRNVAYADQQNQKSNHSL